MNRPSDFWSRRKAQVEAEAATEARAAEAEAQALREAELATKSDTEILEELNLPDPDTLVQGDDFSAFMARAVPERIRRRALRRLWVSNPLLANLDGLLDYDADYTDKACVVENMKTAYQVGKGMLAHVEEMARQAELEANPPAAEVSRPEAEETAQAEDHADETEQTATAPQPEADQPEAVVTLDETPAAPPRRRMSFHFQDRVGVSA